MKHATVLTIAAGLLACGAHATEAAPGSAGAETGAEATTTTEDGGGGPDTSAGDGADVGTSQDDGPSDEGDGGNEGSDTTDGDVDPVPCDKVDFLFVIDNSVSMQDNQEALVTSFPGFIDTIETTIATSGDFQIMVVDTDAETRCTEEFCADPYEGANEDPYALTECFLWGGSYGCEAQYSECDLTLGAGVIHPAGNHASNEVCELAGPQRYITPLEPDRHEAFGCTAKVGTAGDPHERPMDAMVAALSDELNGPGGCNEGFSRPDALLVILFISDDPKYEDSGVPQSWYDAVVEAKGGPQYVVVGGLVPDYAQDCAVEPHINAGKHWRQFVDLWGDHGHWDLVCQEDYAPFFAEMVGVLENACNQ